MDLQAFTYAGLLLATIAVPLALSFDKNVHFWTRWKYLFPAILITAVVFIYWDIQFTAAGIWSFNHHYVVGAFFYGLPVEEWLFFLIVPYVFLCFLIFTSPVCPEICLMVRRRIRLRLRGQNDLYFELYPHRVQKKKSIGQFL